MVYNSRLNFKGFPNMYPIFLSEVINYDLKKKKKKKTSLQNNIVYSLSCS